MKECLHEARGLHHPLGAPHRAAPAPGASRLGPGVRSRGRRRRPGQEISAAPPRALCTTSEWVAHRPAWLLGGPLNQLRRVSGRTRTDISAMSTFERVSDAPGAPTKAVRLDPVGLREEVARARTPPRPACARPAWGMRAASALMRASRPGLGRFARDSVVPRLCSLRRCVIPCDSLMLPGAMRILSRLQKGGAHMLLLLEAHDAGRTPQRDQREDPATGRGGRPGRRRADPARAPACFVPRSSRRCACCARRGDARRAASGGAARSTRPPTTVIQRRTPSHGSPCRPPRRRCIGRPSPDWRCGRRQATPRDSEKAVALQDLHRFLPARGRPRSTRRLARARDSRGVYRGETGRRHGVLYPETGRQNNGSLSPS